MSNLPALKTVFAQYAGKEIKNPGRLTCDCDEVMDGLVQEIRQNGFIVGVAQEKGVSAPGNEWAVPPTVVTPEFEKRANGKLYLTGGFKLGNRAG